MILADAIEAWGQAHKTRLEQANLEKLGSVWSTIRRAEVGSRPVSDMSKEDARSVMLLFGEDDRGDIADLLNTIRTWTLDQPDMVAQPSFALDDGGVDTVDYDVNEDSGSTPLAVVTPIGNNPLAPPLEPVTMPPQFGDPPQLTLAETQAMPTIQAPTPLADSRSRLTAPEIIPQGPAPALPPPLGYEEQKPDPPFMMIGIGLLVAIVLVGAYVLLSGGEDDPTGTETSVETTEGAVETAPAAAVTTQSTGAIVDSTGAAVTGAAITADSTGDRAPTDRPEGDATEGVEPVTVDPLARFCSESERFDLDTALALTNRTQGEGFYARLITDWSSVAAIAPADVAGDFAVVQAEYVAQRDLAAAAGYDMASPTLLTEIDSRDRSATEAAHINISNYLVTNCQLDVGGFLGTLG